MAEKRNINRYRKRLQLRFGENGPAHMAFTEDISESGLFIRTSRVYPPNTNLEIELLSIEDDELVNMKGVVMWAKAVPSALLRTAKKSGMGVKITNITSGEGSYNKLLD